MTLTLDGVARALGGEVISGEVLAPGPNHSCIDRSLSVRLIEAAPDGFVVHSFSDDDPMRCRDYVRERLGLPRWEPGRGNKHATKPRDERSEPSRRELRRFKFDFCDKTGKLRYSKIRIEFDDGSKAIFFDKGGRNGSARNGSAPLLYGAEHLADLDEGQPVWIVEGEKHVQRLRALGAIGVSGDTGHKSKFLPDHVEQLRGLPVILWPDSDEPGEIYIANAAAAIRAEDPEADIRVVRPFGPPNGIKGKDICDWRGTAEDLAQLAAGASAYETTTRQEKTDAHEKVDARAKAAKPPPETRNAKTLRDKVFDPVKFIVRGYVVEGATILAGRPKIGKSWLVLDWALATARGGFCLGDVRCKEGAVLFIALEDNERRLKVRIKKILGDVDWPEKFEYATEWPRTNEGGLDAIRKWIVEHEDARLVVVDVLQAFRTVAGGRDNLYASDYDAIKNLQAIASEMHVAIIIVHHLRKSAADNDPQDKISGSLGHTGGADTFMILDGTSNGTTLYGRGRDIVEFEKSIVFNRDSCRWEVLGDASTVKLSTERAAILETLESANESMTPFQIAQETGLSRGSVRNILRKLVIAGEVLSPKRSQYLHPNSRKCA